MLCPFKTLEFWEVRRRLGKVDLLLDVGCGDGTQSILFGAGFVCGVDPVARPRQSHNYRFSTEWPSIYSHYDAVTSVCVLEHVDSDIEFLEKCHESLYNGGKIVLSVDGVHGVGHALKRKHMDDHSVKRYYTRASLLTAMSDAGFKDIQTKYLLKSRLAKKMFSWCIKRNKFKFPKLLYFPALWALMIAERRSTGRGMYVIGWGKK